MFILEFFQFLAIRSVVFGISDEVQIAQSGAGLLMRFEDFHDLELKVLRPSGAALRQSCQFNNFIQLIGKRKLQFSLRFCV